MTEVLPWSDCLTTKAWLYCLRRSPIGTMGQLGLIKSLATPSLVTSAMAQTAPLRALEARVLRTVNRFIASDVYLMVEQATVKRAIPFAALLLIGCAGATPQQSLEGLAASRAPICIRECTKTYSMCVKDGAIDADYETRNKDRQPYIGH